MTPNERSWSWKLWAAGACAAALLSMQAGRWASPALARASLNADIVKVADTYRRAVVAGDARAAAATYRDDGVELGPCGTPLKGRAAIEEHYRRMFENVKFTTFTFSHLEATADGNLGYAAGTYEEIAGPAGTPGMNLTGKYLVLLKRGPDGWKSAYVIYNFDGTAPPCAGTTGTR